MATKRPAAKKAAAKKPAGKKKSAARKTAGKKKPAAKKTAAKTPATRKTAAKKPAVRKTAAKKTTAPKGRAARAKADAAQSSSHRDRNTLYSRAIVDPDFRKRLLADPDGVLKSEGYDVDAATIEQIKSSAGESPEALEQAIAAAAREGGVGG